MNAERVKVAARGAVQGVGFRPFVYRLATDLGLRGWVSNSSQGVFIEVEGESARLNQFLLRLRDEQPPRASIQSLEFSFLEAIGYAGFEIRPSDENGGKNAVILPDIAACSMCLDELFDVANRRHLYPFINCTNCGPRFSIIESLPYDRPNTSMKAFAMCAECQEEYNDPAHRRFHAQPNACPRCGPRLALWTRTGNILDERHDALLRAAAAVRDGQILALKGVGGFQLIVDARNEAAVNRLRARKCREEKPFALMYPTLDMLRPSVSVGEFEARLLASPEAPIILLEKTETAAQLARSVAPGNPNIGAMLPASPLHHLLMRELSFPVVATSGNLSNEPICIDEREALERLGGIADLFLVHDRPIVRQVDDSVVRVVLGREMMLRRARGYAPLPIHFPRELPPILAVGSHLKNSVALSLGKEIFVSQHIGDLETPEALAAFRRTASDLQRLYEFKPETVACDLHPEYLSTKYAKTQTAPLALVQHHYAHVLACMAENELDGPVLGVSWDGTGLGPDGTIWGGEFLLVDAWPQNHSAAAPFTRLAHLRKFRLPGGEAAIKQPRRAALGLLWEIFGEKLFEREDILPVQQFSRLELGMMRQILANGVNAPITSSAGRLFDAVASLLGLRHRSHFEGQAAMDLEFSVQPGEERRFSRIEPMNSSSPSVSLSSAAEERAGERRPFSRGGFTERSYPFKLAEERNLVLDWQPMILQMQDELSRGEPVGRIARAFHNTLAEMVVAVAQHAGAHQIVLTGGCFQNKYLLERAVQRLGEEEFQPHWHQRIPPNDGGIALGQVVGAARASGLRRETQEACYA